MTCNITKQLYKNKLTHRMRTWAKILQHNGLITSAKEVMFLPIFVCLSVC